jgi:nucleoside-diphosphate-sugar epimerase
MRRLLITGAAGVVGTMLRSGLHGVADEMRQVDRRPIDGEDVMVGDITDPAFARSAIAGCDACVHLAAHPGGGAVRRDPAREPAGRVDGLRGCAAGRLRAHRVRVVQP